MTTDNMPPHFPEVQFVDDENTARHYAEAYARAYAEQHTAELRKQYRQLVTSLAEQQAYPDDWWQDELRRLESL